MGRSLIPNPVKCFSYYAFYYLLYCLSNVLLESRFYCSFRTSATFFPIRLTALAHPIAHCAAYHCNALPLLFLISQIILLLLLLLASGATEITADFAAESMAHFAVDSVSYFVASSPTESIISSAADSAPDFAVHSNVDIAASSITAAAAHRTTISS